MEAIRSLLIDRRTYEQNLEDHWRNRQPWLTQPNQLSARLLCLLAVDHGQHRLEGLNAAANGSLRVVQLEYRDHAELDPGSYRWQSPDLLQLNSGCKGEMVAIALQALGPALRHFDYVAFIDDDVALALPELQRACNAAQSSRIDAFQLRLEHQEDSVWGELLSAPPGPIWKPVPFVEMMAPVVNRRALPLLRAALRGSVSGFGSDYYLQPILQKLWPELRIAVWGGASLRHERPVQTIGTRRFRFGRTAAQEEEWLRAALLRVLLSAGNRPLTPYSLARALFWALRPSAEADPLQQAFSAAFEQTTHRHWSFLHDIGEDLPKLQQELRRLQAVEQELRAIRQSRSWRSVERYRRHIGDPLRRLFSRGQAEVAHDAGTEANQPVQQRQP